MAAVVLGSAVADCCPLPGRQQRRPEPPDAKRWHRRYCRSHTTTSTAIASARPQPRKGTYLAETGERFEAWKQISFSSFVEVKVQRKFEPDSTEPARIIDIPASLVKLEFLTPRRQFPYDSLVLACGGGKACCVMSSTSAEFDTQYKALTEGVGLVDFSDRTQIELTGADRAQFLHNLCTNAVRDLPPGRGCEAFLLNVKGHVIAHVSVFVSPHSIVLETVPDQAEKLTVALGSLS